MVGVRLESLSRFDRLLTLMPDKRSVRLWIATSTPESRSNYAGTKFERLRMMPPGRRPDAVVYQTPKERPDYYFAQNHVHWVHAMFEFLGVKLGELNLMPGFAEKTKLFVMRMTEKLSS